MSYTYLQEQGEESLAECFSDIPQSVLSNLNLTAEKSYSKDNETASCPSSQSGMMSPPLTGSLGEEKSMSYAGVSLVPTSRMETNGMSEAVGFPGLRGAGDRFGLKCLELFAKYDPSSSSWKMCQTSLNLGLEQSSETWPKAGIIQDGVCWEAKIAEESTREIEYGFSLFTPTSTDYKRNNLSTPMWERRMKQRKSPGTLPEQLAWMGFKGMLAPTLPEKMMRWPIGWTDLRQLGMDKMQLWLQQHGESLEENK